MPVLELVIVCLYSSFITRHSPDSSSHQISKTVKFENKPLLRHNYHNMNPFSSLLHVIHKILFSSLCLDWNVLVGKCLYRQSAGSGIRAVQMENTISRNS